MFNESIIKNIVDAWQEDQNHPNRDRRKRTVPSYDDIKSLIEASFWASIKTEEGQTVKFSITYLSKEHYKKEKELSGKEPLTIEFSEEIDLSPHALTKIANSFDKKNSSLAVGKNTEGQYKIWGTIFFNCLDNYFVEIPVIIPKNIYFRPDVLSVTVTNPGSLLISRGDSVIGRYENGVFLRSIPTPFNSRSLGKYFLEMFKHNSSDESVVVQTFSLIYHSINTILSYLEEHSHGASIIIIPEREISLYREHYKAKYEIVGDYQLGDLLADLLNLPSNPETSLINIGYKNAVFNRLLAIARLACTDGALILTSNLKVPSFGATLSAEKKWSGKVIVGPDGFNECGENFPYKTLGTRHNSMIDFIGECEGAIGFVISQDGPNRAFVKKNENTVLCWPDCRVSMFI